MADFVKLPDGDYMNLDYITFIGVDSDSHITLDLRDGSQQESTEDNARAILAHIRGHSNGSYPSEAATQAAELAKTLGGNGGRRFDFTDAHGNPRRAETTRDGNQWGAVVDGEVYGPYESEAGAMSAAMESAK